MSNPIRNIKQFLFLFQLFLGAIFGIFLLSSLLSFLLETYPTQSYSFFIGLIISSIPIVAKQQSIRFSFQTNAIISATIFSLLLLSKLPSANENISDAWLILSGFIAASSMIIPGLSGSFILLLMGSYEPIVTAVKTTDISLLKYVFIGAILGIISTSKLIKFLLKAFPNVTYKIIIGLLVGSSITIMPTIGSNPTTILTSFISFLIGVTLVKTIEFRSLKTN